MLTFIQDFNEVFLKVLNIFLHFTPYINRNYVVIYLKSTNTILNLLQIRKMIIRLLASQYV